MSNVVWTQELKRLVNTLPDGERIIVEAGGDSNRLRIIEKLARESSGGADDREFVYVLRTEKIGDGYLGGYGN